MGDGHGVGVRRGAALVLTAFALATVAMLAGPTSAAAAGADRAAAYPRRAVAVYSMLWADSGARSLDAMPPEVNVVNLAFARGNPPTLVGPSPQGEAALEDGVRALRARGVRVVLSIGGAGGTVDTSDRDAFVRGVMAISRRLPLDGIDWDVEGAALDADDVVAISTALRERRGRDFAVTLAPNGSTIDDYLPVAVGLQRAGVLTMIGQQFYDAHVTTAAARGRLAQAVAAGIPEDRLGVGMMIADDDHHWTVDQSVAAVRALRAAHPRLRGGYLWESSRPGTDAWAARVGPLLTGS